MTSDAWLEETYFEWLRREAFSSRTNRKEFEGVLRLLHDIPFYWTIWSDENRAGDALSFRQSDFLGFQNDIDNLDQIWLGRWATATPSVLEVLLGMARRWAFYFQGSVPFYFQHMFENLSLYGHPGRVLTGRSANGVRNRLDIWMSHQFEPDGEGSPFPISNPRALGIMDMRELDVWGQMNAYSAEHFQ